MGQGPRRWRAGIHERHLVERPPAAPRFREPEAELILMPSFESGTLRGLRGILQVGMTRNGL